MASGKGLNPPWTRLASPFCVINKERVGGNQIRYIFKTIDRITGKTILEKDLEQQTGLQPSSRTFYRDSNKVVLSMVGDGGQLGAVVIGDLQTGTFESPIPVGQYPTNVVSISP